MATQNANTDEGGNVPQPVIEDLAAAVVGTRKDCPTSAVSATDREAMIEELFTEHIPKLTATGVVAYDSLLGAVELRRRDLAP